ncbi:hypothetical protein GLAREA_02263 [Glarea lozoyensis ATCC 20868]|uniref:Uncharacterized protein n=1 Tax=Glarea lozoyensis (strain ATCC 20868 / MF5171) TaxID=1116229 RepID=S3D2T6_GLAL2|nr:uncharacterized protein GLAREA_02263 [Glarea lozoyensis ATCC 20868]EPE26351.1 hypothetical protein GLAREA_02263 [Glarea lozoyensis ATCC 20868]
MSNTDTRKEITQSKGSHKSTVVLELVAEKLYITWTCVCDYSHSHVNKPFINEVVAAEEKCNEKGCGHPVFINDESLKQAEAAIVQFKEIFSGEKPNSDKPPTYDVSQDAPPKFTDYEIPSTPRNPLTESTINLDGGAHRRIHVRFEGLGPGKGYQLWFTYFCTKTPQDKPFVEPSSGFVVNTAKERCLGCGELMLVGEEARMQAGEATDKFRAIVDRREKQYRGIR